MTEQIKELQKDIGDLKRRVKALEDWIATHHCQSYPANIKRIIGVPMPAKGEPFIPSVEI
ncbi:MAG TPA: hypothetical protein VMW45_04340 [Dehalococcoidia bacterium]|nr:hypothetical protein [Dehalococcoidia bacterium]